MSTGTTTFTLGSCLVAALALPAHGSTPLEMLDQIGDRDGTAVSAGTSYNNQIFETALGIYDIAAVDDFEYAPGTVVTSVEVVISGFNGYSGLDGMQGLQVNFYDDYRDVAETGFKGYVSADLLTVPAADASWQGSGTLVAATSENGWTLNPGRQYVAVTPFNEFATNGQVGVLGSLRGNGEAWQINPRGGYGQGAYWQIPADLAYRVTGFGEDCNANGQADAVDLSTGSSVDLDGNGIPDECECPDVTGDGLVDVNDILAMLGDWGDCAEAAPCSSDVTGDRRVDVNDTLAILGGWGTCAGP